MTGGAAEPIPPSAKRYLATVLQAAREHPLGCRDSRELKTLASCMDLLAMGDLLHLGDILRRRFKSAEQVNRDPADRLELLAGKMLSAASQQRMDIAQKVSGRMENSDSASKKSEELSKDGLRHAKRVSRSKSPRRYLTHEKRQRQDETVKGGEQSSAPRPPGSPMTRVQLRPRRDVSPAPDDSEDGPWRSRGSLPSQPRSVARPAILQPAAASLSGAQRIQINNDIQRVAPSEAKKVDQTRQGRQPHWLKRRVAKRAGKGLIRQAKGSQ